MNEFEALTNLGNGPIIFTYYSERELSTSTLQYGNLTWKPWFQRSGFYITLSSITDPSSTVPSYLNLDGLPRSDLRPIAQCWDGRVCTFHREISVLLVFRKYSTHFKRPSSKYKISNYTHQFKYDGENYSHSPAVVVKKPKGKGLVDRSYSSSFINMFLTQGEIIPLLSLRLTLFGVVTSEGNSGTLGVWCGALRDGYTELQGEGDTHNFPINISHIIPHPRNIESTFNIYENILKICDGTLCHYTKLTSNSNKTRWKNKQLKYVVFKL